MHYELITMNKNYELCTLNYELLTMNYELLTMN